MACDARNIKDARNKGKRIPYIIPTYQNKRPRLSTHKEKETK
jgi:hypothetical protein